MKKLFLTIIAVLLIFSALLAGCGKHAAELSPTTQPEATADPYAGMVQVPDGAGGTMWVNEAEELDLFAMDRTLFSVTNAIPSYAGEGYTLRRGIDVSDHQGEIDWNAAAASGMDFAIIRCGWRGYGGGSLNEDARYRQNIEGAQAAGLDVGVYFFSQAVSIVEAAEEALYTIKLLEGYNITLPVFFDWEIIGVEPARTDDVSGDTVTDACLEFCRLLEDAGYDTGVYAYLNLAYNTYDLNRLKDVTIWMGDPGTQPDFYYDHTYWQYSYTGTVPGIEGDVDMDAIFISTTPQIVNISEGSEQTQQ